MTDAPPSIGLKAFEASDFNIAALVESLMEDGVRKAKAEGQGGELVSSQRGACRWSAPRLLARRNGAQSPESGH